MTRPAPKRCAIYTRKSSDEGLDQAFNSLDAQREAGEAYVKSQASEGWRVIQSLYDDGGFSGGTMDRPGLRRLLADVEAGLIDVVVVYKIDRLTRSLADFARIVERFDGKGVNFVSVTQAFNTTSSMGRLTLNVLLSFAQFEREVTGERIRDKIAASKAKGMWMGGIPPLGYDPPVGSDRVLRVNEAEAATVRLIYARYLELGSVHHLADELARDGLVSKVHVTAAGRALGGKPYGRGALFHLLRNRIYLGQIVHKGTVHPGAHPAIVDQALFDTVQAGLDAQRRRQHSDAAPRMVTALLTGRLFDTDGTVMSPTFSRGARGTSYRYYVSSPLQRGQQQTDGTIRRVSATAIEALVTAIITRLLHRAPDPVGEIRAVHLRRDGLDLILPGAAYQAVTGHLDPGEAARRAGSDCVVSIAVAFPLRGGRASTSAGERNGLAPDPVLVAALRRAHAVLERDSTGRPALISAPASIYDRKILRLAFLDPALQDDILAGRQPRGFRLEAFVNGPLSLSWDEQRRVLGWPVRPRS